MSRSIVAHSGSGAGTRGTERGVHPERVARVGRRLAVALVGAAVPALAAVVTVAIASGAVDGSLLAWLAGAVATDVAAGTGLPWAFHVAALTAVAGVATHGFALVVEASFGVD